VNWKACCWCLALIYLSECLAWVPRGALAFASWRGIHFGLRLRAHGWAINVAACCSPIHSRRSARFSSFQPPAIALTRSRVRLFVGLSRSRRPAVQQPDHLSFKEIPQRRVDGRKVLVNGELFLKPLQPIPLAGWPNRFVASAKLPNTSAPPPSSKCSTTVWTRRSSPPMARLQTRVRPIRILSNGLFVYLFLVVGAVDLEVWLWAIRLMAACRHACSDNHHRRPVSGGRTSRSTRTLARKRLKPFLTMAPRAAGCHSARSDAVWPGISGKNYPSAGKWPRFYVRRASPRVLARQPGLRLALSAVAGLSKD